ncbi:MAG: ATP-dependent endonuclease [Clostridiaceae bacterium]|nr:ATP-dependent endonuclease [Clostridiaceae bacterium]
MKIHSVGIRNFRSLEDVNITFDSVTTFIGPNGAGKSTVLRALDWFFNGGRSSVLTDEDCSYGNTDENIEVRVTFSNLTDKDRESLGKYAPSDIDTFTAWKVRSHDGTEVLSANIKSYPPFSIIRDANTATERKEAYNQLKTENPGLDLPSWTNQNSALEAMTLWESNNTDKLTETPSHLQTNFFGFNSDGKMSGLFDYVLVTADLRAGEETQDAKASIIGHILERTIDRTAADEEIEKIVERSRLEQQEVCKEKFGDQLKEVERKLNEVILSYSMGRSVEVFPAEIELKPPKTTFNVSVHDGNTETKVEGQGHGFQRTLLISALQVLAESTAADTDGVFCLAIEEPELFQHPTQAQAFARVLRTLADDPSKGVQVVYATHSPFFIEAKHFDQIRRLTRSSDERPVVTVHSSTVDNVKSSLEGIQDPGSIDRQLDTLTAGQLSSALFASKALVVEGTTESAVFYGLGDRDAPAKLEAAGISVVPANGKNSVPLTHAVLSSLGIPCYALFDADAGFRERGVKNGKSQRKIKEEENNHKSANRKLLRYFKLSEEDFPAQTVNTNVAIFEDHLEAFLDSEWPEWSDSCVMIEASTGIVLKKNQFAYRAATSNAEGKVPNMLKQILKKLEEL